MTTISERARAFSVKYGRGDRKLTPIHIKNRQEKLLGTMEATKIKGLGAVKSQGVSFNNSMLSPQEDAEGVFDNLPIVVIDNLDNYPLDIRSQDGNHRIINLDVKDDGSVEIKGIIKDGNEHNPVLRSIYSVSLPSDEEMARIERKQYEKEELKEVSDRTLSLHEPGYVIAFENDNKINTNPDTDIQY